VKGLAGELGAILDPLVDADPVEVSIAPGYMGVAEQWCWWESEYPEEGVVGPYASEAAAREAAAQNFTNSGMAYMIDQVYTEEQFRKTFKLPPTPTPEQKAASDEETAFAMGVTKREDGAYTVGPPPDGRSVVEHLDELAKGEKKWIAGDHSDVPVSES
jgi:hypothetical protein